MTTTPTTIAATVKTPAHTPGPWVCSGGAFEPDCGVSYTLHADAMNISKANARLITAAPAMFEALRLWLVYDQSDASSVEFMLAYDRALAATRAALSATTGEA